MIAALLALFASTGWQDARAIVVPPAALPAYVRLALPQTIDGGADAAYPDLRVVDGDGKEVPYALDADPMTYPGVRVPLSDVGFVPGRFTQAIADLNEAPAQRSSLDIVTSLPTFFARVEIASSDDRKTWTVLVPNALIYRVKEQDVGNTTVSFGASRARWLRVRILDPNRTFPIEDARVPAFQPAPQDVPLAGAQTLQQSGSNSIVTFAFPSAHSDLVAVAFETTTPQFKRDVTIASKGDNDEGWNDVATGTIVRYSGSGHPPDQASVDVSQRVGQQMRATVANLSDAPLAGLHVTPFARQHYIVFRALPGVQYRLLWNAPGAEAAHYDLGDVLQQQGWSIGAVATLGAATSAVTGFAAGPSTPWLQSAALPIALAAMFVVLLGVAFLAMRSKPA